MSGLTEDMHGRRREEVSNTEPSIPHSEVHVPEMATRGQGRHNRRMNQALGKFPAAVDADIEDVRFALSVWSGVSDPAEPKNKRGMRTRQHLLDAGTRALIRHGYVDCAVEDVLQEADVSRGTFYAHFKSKKALFAAIIERSIASRLTSTDVSEMDVPLIRDRIEASVRKFLDSFHQTLGLSLVIEQVAHHDESFRRVRLLIRDSFARRIAKGIRRQQAQGSADPEVDPAEAALAIVSMMSYYAQTELGWRGRQPSEEMVDLLTRFWVKGISLREDAPVRGQDAGTGRTQTAAQGQGSGASSTAAE
ncbi:hypothetical protein GCM10009823_11360 [Brevibacterium salitolerans]|uniref:HTH tetR-type domain-containing protein n=2 Tax=Brevibacterium salitolerans TaxID=1403566 RepID=A0ABN2WJK5_9MICO